MYLLNSPAWIPLINQNFYRIKQAIFKIDVFVNKIKIKHLGIIPNSALNFYDQAEIIWKVF